MKFLVVDPPHKIREFLRAWVPSPACLQLAAYLERGFDLEFLERTIQSNKPIIKHQHWHFLKIGVTAFKHEVFGFPMWVQETYQTFEDYLKERGKPQAPGL
ncbi:MAG: hypothetical protein A2Y65_04560 [Deltaproteobacteria bacterium RBG_13_52_11]|nr:MAG: hypothetical protein A2Y65_04560 [Deltaproteobacteria bacterium RBG_13_52_11]